MFKERKNEHQAPVCSIGGIPIDVTDEFQNKKISFAKGLQSFFSIRQNPPSAFEEKALRFHLSIGRRKYACPSLEKIFSFHRVTLYRTTEGYLQQFSLADDARLPVWAVVIDKNFLTFNCLLQPENDLAESGSVLLDPYGPILSLFLLQHSFIRHQGLIIHAAGGSIQGKGIAFTAPSGTGKSTLGGLLLHSPENRLFSEERLLLRFLDRQWRLWGTPWHGQSTLARNETAPLSALIFLRQAKTTRISRLRPADGLRRLLQVVSIPWYSEDWTHKGLALCESLIQDVPMFELAFRPDQTAVQEVEHLAAML